MAVKNNRINFCGLLYPDIETIIAPLSVQTRLGTFAEDIVWASEYGHTRNALKLVQYLFDFNKHRIPLDPILHNYFSECETELNLECFSLLNKNFEDDEGTFQEQLDKSFAKGMKLRSGSGEKFKLNKVYDAFLTLLSFLNRFKINPKTKESKYPSRDTIRIVIQTLKDTKELKLLPDGYNLSLEFKDDDRVQKRITESDFVKMESDRESFCQPLLLQARQDYPLLLPSELNSYKINIEKLYLGPDTAHFLNEGVSIDQLIDLVNLKEESSIKQFQDSLKIYIKNKRNYEEKVKLLLTRFS